MNKLTFLLLAALMVIVSACKDGKESKTTQSEDLQAKQLLQGIWVDSDEENVVFKVKGDTIFYPDSLSQPVRFAVYGDTLVIQSASESKYGIIKQTEHLFEFKNSNGDIVKLLKSNDPSFELQFGKKKPTAVNQNKILKSDSIVFCGSERYHSYVQVNPTRYKVLKSSFNDDGMEMETVYFDNTIHVSIFKQQAKIFSKDFNKRDFAKYVPKDFLRQSVLSDITLSSSSSNTLHYLAQLAIPDSYVSYIVNIDITTDGKLSMSIQK